MGKELKVGNFPLISGGNRKAKASRRTEPGEEPPKAEKGRQNLIRSAHRAPAGK